MIVLSRSKNAAVRAGLATRRGYGPRRRRTAARAVGSSFRRGGRCPQPGTRTRAGACAAVCSTDERRAGGPGGVRRPLPRSRGRRPRRERWPGGVGVRGRAGRGRRHARRRGGARRPGPGRRRGGRPARHRGTARAPGGPACGWPAGCSIPRSLADGLPRAGPCAVLAADRFDAESDAAADAVQQVVAAAAALGPVVLDLPRHRSDVRTAAESLCDLVVLLVRPDVTGLVAARAATEVLVEPALGLVVRRPGAARRGGAFTAHDVADVVGAGGAGVAAGPATPATGRGTRPRAAGAPAARRRHPHRRRAPHRARVLGRVGVLRRAG